ncbi:MAG: sigma-70 family RNA polymerase sigma factor [Candidatus Falkowbacteria bacterium]
MDNNIKEKFSQVYKDHAPAILRHIYFRVSNYDLARDLTQDVFLKTWNYMALEGNHVKDHKNFLYMVANNLIIDHYRQKNKLPLWLEEVSEKEITIRPTQEHETDMKIKLAIFRKLLSKLESNYRKIISYRYLNHMSINEICALTGKSPNHVSVIIYQGTKILKSKIDDFHAAADNRE